MHIFIDIIQIIHYSTPASKAKHGNKKGKQKQTTTISTIT